MKIFFFRYIFETCIVELGQTYIVGTFVKVYEHSKIVLIMFALFILDVYIIIFEYFRQNNINAL